MIDAISLRARIVILVLLVGLAPLAALGLWLSERTAATGEAVLRDRLRQALVEERERVEEAWVPYRSRLLDMPELPAVRRALMEDQLPEDPPPELLDAFRGMDLSLEAVRIRQGDRVWALDRGTRTPSAFGLPLQVQLPIYAGVSGDSVGVLEASINISALRGQPVAPVAGAVSTALDPRSGAVLLPTPIDRTLLSRPRFSWDGEPWVAERIDGVEPPVQLVAAAPLNPFASPFVDIGRRSLFILGLVLVVGVLLAVLLSRRLTASLQTLADGAAAVAAGDLSRTVPVVGDDEVSRVARAFNTMTDNLRRTLDQLAERESLAAVNEFAAALAHEVRNPLTAIQLDLQEVEERLPADPELRSLQAQALADLRKLDRTVGGALETARSGRVQPRQVRLDAIIEAATRAAQPSMQEAGATLTLSDPAAAAIEITVDPDALERVLLNLLRNAAEAAGEEGQVRLAVDRTAGVVVIRVADTGPGIPADALDRIFAPFYTTRPGGTGVGLAVARRIVTAHRGTLEAENRPEGGALFRITLPTA